MKQGVHSVILTSGTLAPLHATVSELGIPVPVTLENPHIIQPSQVPTYRKRLIVNIVCYSSSNIHTRKCQGATVNSMTVAHISLSAFFD